MKEMMGVEDDSRERSSESSKQAVYVCIFSKLCLCSPFQGDPRGSGIDLGSQNALCCHLFKHSEPLANRDKPLFIKSLILAAWMTT